MSAVTSLQRKSSEREQQAAYISAQLGVTERRAYRIMWTIDHCGGYCGCDAMTRVQLLAAASVVNSALVSHRAPLMLVPTYLEEA